MSDEAASAKSIGGTAFREYGSGSPLVFIHGVGLHSGVWVPQIAAFAPFHRVVTYDMLGHGGSALPPAGGGISAFVEQVRRLFDILSLDQAVLVGHSMGGMIATAFATTYPDRLSGLVVLNAVYCRGEEARASVLARADALDEGGPQATADGAIARWFGPDADLTSDPRAQRLRDWLGAADPVGYARAYRVFAEGDRSSEGRLDRIVAPALFATGELDPNSTPDMARAMALEAPHGEAAILAGERHMMAFVNPESTNALIAGLLDRIVAVRAHATVED